MTETTRKRRWERGTAVVEMAAVLPLLLLLVLGILDFGRVLNYTNDATHLATSGARWAIVDVNPGGGTLQDYVKSLADTPELEQNADVYIWFPAGSAEVGDPVSVCVQFRFGWLNFLSALVGGPQSTHHATSTMRLEQEPTTYAPNPPPAGSECAAG